MSLKKNISLDRNNKIIVRRRVKNDSAKSDKAKRIKSSDRIVKSSTIIK